MCNLIWNGLYPTPLPRWVFASVAWRRIIGVLEKEGRGSRICVSLEEWHALHLHQPHRCRRQCAVDGWCAGLGTQRKVQGAAVGHSLGTRHR